MDTGMSNPLTADLDHILEHTRDLWEEVRGKHIFITGGTGFFGCWLLETFAWANDKLGLNATAVVLTRDLETFRKKAPQLASHPSIKFHIGHVCSFEFPTSPFSHIIHAATEASSKLNNENPLLMLDTIVEGTRRTLEFALKCGAKKYLLTSSGAVYGKQPFGMTHIPENYQGAPDPMDPRSVYGESKRLAEMLCLIYAKQYGLETKISRCFTFVGPYLPLNIHFAIGNFINDGLCGGPIQVRGDGTPYRSYLYTADLMIWLWTILFKGELCRPYNVGSDESISILELAYKVGSCFNDRVEVFVMSKPMPCREPERYVPNVSRGKSELSLQVYTNIENAIQNTISWVKSK
jgi:nucleoside-diphosphate-sugar epimerase